MSYKLTSLIVIGSYGQCSFPSIVSPFQHLTYHSHHLRPLDLCFKYKDYGVLTRLRLGKKSLIRITLTFSLSWHNILGFL